MTICWRNMKHFDAEPKPNKYHFSPHFKKFYSTISNLSNSALTLKTVRDFVFTPLIARESCKSSPYLISKIRAEAKLKNSVTVSICFLNCFEVCIHIITLNIVG